MPVLGLSSADLALRRGRITGTTAAAILGVSPYASQHDAWRRIVLGEEIEQTDAMRWGLLLQEPVARYWADLNGRTITECQTRVSPVHDWLAASGDYHVDGAADLLEIKTATDRQAERWGADGTDEVPLDYWVQTLVQMHCYDAPSVYVAVLFGGRELRQYRVWRNLDVETETLAALGRWHARYVAGGEEPIGTAVDRVAALQARYPRHECPPVQAPPEAERYVEQYRMASQAKRLADGQMAEAKAALCEMIGEAEGLAGDGWLVTWKTPRPARIVDWQAVAMELGAGPEHVERFATERASSRRFTVRFSGEKGTE